MWQQAIEQAVRVTRSNMSRFHGRIPHVGTNGGAYQLIENTEWTSGFWAGILWLCYDYTGDEHFLREAKELNESFRERMESRTSLDHHDIGFLYTLSTQAEWQHDGCKNAEAVTLAAAELMMERWRPEGGFIQAWGPKGDPDNGGRIIIDCLMNLPLLYWAYNRTGDYRYYEAANIHASSSRRFLVRGDDSTYHTFYFDPETGEALRGATQQGLHHGSTWTRGQAWGIYGFALSYRYTKDKGFLDTSRRLARYFLERHPADHAVLWDFDAPAASGTKLDSSASAIAACGILELAGLLEASDPDREVMLEGAARIVRTLVQSCANTKADGGHGFIRHGSYSVKHDSSPDDYLIWGDYFYLEALMRLEKEHPSYW